MVHSQQNDLVIPVWDKLIRVQHISIDDNERFEANTGYGSLEHNDIGYR